MKGLVFTWNRKKRDKSIAITSPGIDIRYLIRRYGAVVFFVAMFICGLTAGSVMCNVISSDTVSKLDFFFTTNIAQRFENGAAGAFCASFASNFVFFLASFLMGFSLWGVVLLPLIVAFKSFGVGISAGYLFMNYAFQGVWFYIAVLLPGIFLFSMALIYQSAFSYNIFKKLCKSLFSKQEHSFKTSAVLYMQQSFKYLLLTLFSAVLDMLLWCVFAGLFKF